MNNLKNKKYIIIPIIIIAVLILVTIKGPYLRPFTQTNSEILEKMDFTGNTQIFLYSFVIINIIICLICLYKGKQGIAQGYDYKFNKIFAITFLILAIIPIISFISIRSMEEELVEQLMKQNEAIFDINNIDFTNKKMTTKLKKAQEQLNLTSTDKYYDRKMEIYNETQNTTKKFERYLSLFIYRPLYNINHHGSYYEERYYYAIFSVFTVINLVSFTFYFISIKDEFKEKQ